MTPPTPPTPPVNLKPPLSPFMSRREVADFLRIHPNSVDKLARENILTRYRIEGLDALLYLREEVKSVVVAEEHPDSNYARRARARARAGGKKPKRRTVS